MTDLPDIIARPAWQDISTAPPRPMVVLFYYGKGASLYEEKSSPHVWDWSLPENAALLADVGYWTGSEWRQAGTNHEVFEFDAKIGDADKPTHWQPLGLPA